MAQIEKNCWNLKLREKNLTLHCYVWHWGKLGGVTGIKMRLEKKDYQLPITTGRSSLPSKTNINLDSSLCLESKTAML